MSIDARLRAAIPESDVRHSHLRRLLEAGLRSSPVLREAAWYTVVAGDLAGAFHLLEEARALPEDRGEAWFAIGLLHLVQRKHEAARDAFRAAAVELLP